MDRVPNRDFVSLQPPLSFYTVAAAFKLFGTSLVSSMRDFGIGNLYCSFRCSCTELRATSMGRELSAGRRHSGDGTGIALFPFCPICDLAGHRCNGDGGAVLFAGDALRATARIGRGRRRDDGDVTFVAAGPGFMPQPLSIAAFTLDSETGP